jgi:hypothetical protein
MHLTCEFCQILVFCNKFYQGVYIEENLEKQIIEPASLNVFVLNPTVFQCILKFRHLFYFAFYVLCTNVM